jgi:hypothetical protein
MEIDSRRPALTPLNTQTGGKIIGKGSYGCAFDPPLKCADGAEKDYTGRKVGKMTSKSEALKENYITAILKQIPSAEKYYSILLDTCALKPRDEQTETDLRKCDVLVRKPYARFTQLIMPYSGQSIHFFNKEIKSGAVNFFVFGRHLLEASALLLTRGVVHYDLHKGNILIQNMATPTIIDFGLSWQVNLLPKIAGDLASHNYEPEYAQYSPELSIPEAINSALPLDDRLFREILEKKRVSKMAERLLGVSMERSIEELGAFVRDSISIKERNWLKFYQTYWPKFDAWSVGRILLEMYYAITSGRGYQPSAKDATYARALRGLCAPNPKKRLNAAQALVIWDPTSPVLRSAEVMMWAK